MSIGSKCKNRMRSKKGREKGRGGERYKKQPFSVIESSKVFDVNANYSKPWEENQKYVFQKEYAFFQCFNHKAPIKQLIVYMKCLCRVLGS